MVKRKGSRSGPAPANGQNKKVKRALRLDQLPWSKSEEAANATRGVFDDESTGFVLGGLEEVSGVDVVYSEQDGRKTASFVVSAAPGEEFPSEQQPEEDQDDADAGGDDAGDEWGGIPSDQESQPESEDHPEEASHVTEQPQASASGSGSKSSSKADHPSGPAKVLSLRDEPFQRVLAPALGRLPVLDALKHSLYASNLNKPTPIQQATWKSVFAQHTGDILPKDVVGVAETGSGKTLAYGLPLLQRILASLLSPSTSAGQLSALILTPTRELALQVRKHLASILDNALAELPSKGTRAPVTLLAITGGMSVQKQRRQLDQGANIVVGTPGRVWDLVSQDSKLAKQIKMLDFLVLDEADRMVEAGHFAELEKIFDLTNRKSGKKDKSEPEGFVNDFEHDIDSAESVEASPDMRTYVFSATMSKELQKNLKKPASKRKSVKAEDKGEMGALGSLMSTLDFRDPEPEVVDLLPQGGKVSSLHECGLDCLSSDKDLQLYHFLLRYPGKSIVFLASIDGIRRLHPLLSLLDLGTVVMLHSGMQQKARLKALDRFKSADKAVLLATDVAARGLDVPEVDHVVHYQLPRSTDTYVHRNGRTARAGREGVSLQLVSPEEKSLQRDIFRALQRDVKDLHTLPVEWTILDRLKTRIQLAKQIDSSHHKVTKQNHEDHWLKEAAEAMEVDLDDLDSDDERRHLKKKNYNAESAAMKHELSEELKRPLMVRGVSARYPTSGLAGQAGFADSMLAKTNHSNFIGVRQADAKADAKNQ